MLKCCSSDRARFASPLSLADKLAVINGLGTHILSTNFNDTFYPHFFRSHFTRTVETFHVAKVKLQVQVEGDYF